MEIKLPHMPFKFDTPEGQMEVTVRSRSLAGEIEGSDRYAAAATFIAHGPRALERIQITPDARTHGEVMRSLVNGFVVNLNAYKKDGPEFRALSALCSAQDVVLLEN